MNKKNFDIDQYEKDIIENFQQGKLVSVDNLKEEMQLAKKAASKFMKRDNRINIRVSGSDLNMIRRIAVQEGLPYQTLLASIIHKFVSGRLIEKSASSR
jgi:predicted DNA binding CopG/RHH family protein